MLLAKRVSQQTLVACSPISQCAAVVALLGRQGCQQHWGVWNPGTGSTAVPSPHSHRAFPGPPAVPSGTQVLKIHGTTGQTTAVTGCSSIKSPFRPWSSRKWCILYRGHKSSVFTQRCFYVIYPTSKGTAPVWGAWLCCGGTTHGSP